MAVYIVTGKLGSGKTLACVGKIRDYLAKDRPVATNLDIYMEKMCSPDSRKTLIRLPDHPTADDMHRLGRGNDTPDETTNGLIVLDECGTWLNSRNYGDKDRQKLIDWALHSRKHGWDLMLIVQDVSIIDKQIRDTISEMVVTCRRLDRIPIPFVSWFLSAFEINLRLPKVHVGIVRYGVERTSLTVDRWVYRAKDLYHVYDTRQVFRHAVEMTNAQGEKVMMPPQGMCTMLSAWHIHGRFQPKQVPWWHSLRHFIGVPAFIIAMICIGLKIAPKEAFFRGNA